MKCLSEIDSVSEGRTICVWDWEKLVDRMHQKMRQIDPTERSEKEKEFRKVTFRVVPELQIPLHFLGIPITDRKMRTIEKRV